MKSVLIGTLVHGKHFPRKTIKQIVEMVSPNKIFISQVVNKDELYLLTYNLENEVVTEKFETLKNKCKQSIRLHRKRKNNILYTINAIKENERKKIINLNEAKNCCLTLDNNKNVSKLELKLVDIFTI